MNNNPYSYDECLAIIELCSGLEFHTRHEPEAKHIRILGVTFVNVILNKNHAERISMIKEAVNYL